MEFTKLNNGVQMPMHGIGTFYFHPTRQRHLQPMHSKRFVSL